MFHTAEFWVLVAFVGFLALVGKKAYVHLTALLDERSKKIEAEIENAKKLLAQAESLLAEYQQKHEEATDQSVEIIARSEKEAMELEHSSERDLQHLRHLREEYSKTRIEQAEKDVKDYLEDKLLQDALRVVEKVLISDPKSTEKLTKSTLKELEGLTLDVGQ